MEEKKEKTKPNKEEVVLDKEENETPNKEKRKKVKTEELKFNFLEVVILVIITAIVSTTVNITINKLKKEEHKLTIAQNEELNKFIDEYNFILNKFYGENAISSETLINNAIAGMVNGLGDPYSSFIPDEFATEFDVELEGEFYGLGVEITINEKNEIVVHSVLANKGAEKAGIKVGDIITHMDGESVVGLSTSDFRTKMLINNKPKVTLTIIRDGKNQDFEITRELVEIESVTSETFESGSSKVGYIRMDIFASNTHNQFKKHLEALEAKNIDSLVVDVRSNTGGHLSVVTDIISEFLDSSHVIYQVKDSKTTTKEYSKGKVTKKYDMIVLIDGASASASELFSSAMKEQYGAKLLGTKSFGKSTVQQVVDLENGSMYKITIKEWLTSKGNVINGKGIEPDVLVNLSEKYFKDPKNENDDQLMEAIKLLKK